MTTETTIVIETQAAEAKEQEAPQPAPRRATKSRASRSAGAGKGRSKRKKVDHRPLKVMLTTGAFLATWMGTSWMAQQDAAAAAAQAQANQPEPVTLAYIAADGTVSERTINLEPVPQVVVTSNSSK